MARLVPPACVRPHAIDDFCDAHDAAKRQLVRQTDAETTFNIFAACIVSPLRCVNENGTTIARWLGPVLDVLHPARD